MEGMGATSLPPGFRFHPTDDELVGYYLRRKVDGKKIELEVIPVIDLYKFDPWELPDKSFLPKRDMEWFFFCPRDRKYPNGSRTNRATASGYWKATGKDRKIICEPSTIGLRKTLVFYRGKAPAGDRTDWIMHEYRLCEELPHGSSAFVGAFALCRVIKRSEQGQKISEASGEPKSKRVAYSAINNLSAGSINGEALGVHETEERSHFNRNNVLTPTTSPSENGSGTESEPIVVDGYQTDHGSHNHHLLDPSKVLSVGVGASSLTTQFTNSMVDSSQYEPMNVSPMLPTTSFMGETYATAGVNNTGSLMTSLNPLDFMETCTNKGAIPFPAFEGVASWNMNPSVSDLEMMSPLICRQNSGDGILEFVNFWLPEESMTVW